MKSRPSPSASSQRSRHWPWAAVALLAVGAAALWTTGVQAQTAGARSGQRSVQAAPNPVPANRAATFGLPNPAGLPSPTPFPGGLPPVVIPSAASPTGAPGFADPGFAGPGSVGTPGTGGVGVVITPPLPFPDGSAGNPTAVLGAGAGPGIPAFPQTVSSGAGPYTPVEVARSFITADANRDGELTQGEWWRLAIRPGSFEAMDRNFDGRISRSEYDDGLR
ncbi:EF-hand domain-containing protein [Ramlibacter tataouinensis]|uniref:EF-hand domain-containing protein n=1 Tax=Ramlibacter tataouinensis (strain ATCC BAA-407 / DSM 14655 / LMG 21543 / TTB310) TaxID=365046 RepID=F5Y361_RAMTT|nr:EF-hand domain-containing protein [Ramlibacter tataouinensis]AEG91148.1 Hypothetical protein Rta_00870 [Ramlibacter tataouinensis TTB310]